MMLLAGLALPRQTRRSSISDQPELPQDVLRSEARAAGHRLRPDLVGNAVALRQDTPVWRVLRLEPLKVVDLVPLVLARQVVLARLFVLPLAAALDRREEWKRT